VPTDETMQLENEIKRREKIILKAREK